MEHRSRFFDRMLECSPLWYLTLFSEHASQSFWSPSPPMSARVANRMLLHFDRYFTLQSWRFEIRIIFIISMDSRKMDQTNILRNMISRSISRRITFEKKLE